MKKKITSALVAILISGAVLPSALNVHAYASEPSDTSELNGIETFSSNLPHMIGGEYYHSYTLYGNSKSTDSLARISRVLTNAGLTVAISKFAPAKAQPYVLATAGAIYELTSPNRKTVYYKTTVDVYPNRSVKSIRVVTSIYSDSARKKLIKRHSDYTPY